LSATSGHDNNCQIIHPALLDHAGYVANIDINNMQYFTTVDQQSLALLFGNAPVENVFCQTVI